MKRELKRIEAALHHLADQHSNPSTVSLPARGFSPQSPADGPAPLLGPPVAKVALPTLPVLPAMPEEEHGRPEADARTVARTEAGPAAPKEAIVEPLSASLNEVKAPALPRLKTPSFSSHRNAANPTLAMSLLKEMETTVAGWQEELQQVLRQIQDLYLEGPIVDGWLESYAQQEGEAPEFRHADVDCLMNYIEKMKSVSQPDLPQTASLPYGARVPQDGNTAGYRLCGLNEDGQLWFRHCPAEQVPAVGMAIARYQRLRLLLSRKQYLETRLSQLAETLVTVHGQLN